MSYSWSGGPNQGQVHRDTFYGNYLGTPHNVPGTMLPSHNGPHQSAGRYLGPGSSMKNGIPAISSVPQNARMPGFPNFSSARGSALKYTPPP